MKIWNYDCKWYIFEKLENYKLNNGNTLTRDLHYHETVLHEYSMKQDQYNPTHDKKKHVLKI